MTDAAKRRFDFDDDASSVLSSEWEHPPSVAASHVSSVGSMPHVEKDQHVNTKNPAPKDATFKEWGQTVRMLDKVKHMEATYVQLIDIADTQSWVHEYLKWPKSNHGTKSANYAKATYVTRAMDCAMFLEAVGWEARPSNAKASALTFTRTVKK